MFRQRKTDTIRIDLSLNEAEAVYFALPQRDPRYPTLSAVTERLEGALKEVWRRG